MTPCHNQQTKSKFSPFGCRDLLGFKCERGKSGAEGGEEKEKGSKENKERERGEKTDIENDEFNVKGMKQQLKMSI